MQPRSEHWNALADVECEYRAAACRILAAPDTGIPGTAAARPCLNTGKCL